MNLQVRSQSLCILAILITMVSLANGHGRLRDPPSRSSLWREGFKTPPDYNDTEGFCGGYERQWMVNGGKCGICGDAFDEAVKPHEAPGGIFATGTIVRRYTQGQTIPVKIEITAKHKGFYEFKLCPNNNVLQDPTQACFDRFPLSFISVEGIISKRIFVDSVPQGTYAAEIMLPPKVTCSQCIIQWTYVTGNRWGRCRNGTDGLGCGPQETFRACSDVAVVSSDE
ncbi:hypothetical protein DAPPUDRAFT_317372 [Daphnia pulex]|uniref:Chitin-binding type-4 domain-containing protein n=1 Tax=Daphnia pulex TaxID=6669 RepID=E9GFS4_DAPPU|nr:hypothetical protein DAPPUDRAFT_317372 [Daphnia pulex]|eukprot:EFX81690.1 hypothetical protein DAPPUDRAFT_317372 [Daphnia pulex]